MGERTKREEQKDAYENTLNLQSVAALALNCVSLVRKRLFIPHG